MEGSCRDELPWRLPLRASSSGRCLRGQIYRSSTDYARRDAAAMPVVKIKWNCACNFMGDLACVLPPITKQEGGGPTAINWEPLWHHRTPVGLPRQRRARELLSLAGRARPVPVLSAQVGQLTVFLRTRIAQSCRMGRSTAACGAYNSFIVCVASFCSEGRGTSRSKFRLLHLAVP